MALYMEIRMNATKTGKEGGKDGRKESEDNGRKLHLRVDKTYKKFSRVWNA